MWYFWIACFWAHAEVECPKADLRADGLDVYRIIVEDNILSFRFQPNDVVELETSIAHWESMLDACGAKRTKQSFQVWKRELMELRTLGLMYSGQGMLNKIKTRKQIRVQERRTVLLYAKMLDILEKEVGIAVVWDLENYRRTKGLVSSARGSARIVDYINVMYGVESVEN